MTRDSAIHNLEFELKIRKRKLKNSNARREMNRRVTEHANIESRAAGVERRLQGMIPLGVNPLENRNRRRNRAVNNKDHQFEEEMSEKFDELSKRPEAAVDQSRRLSTENNYSRTSRS